MNCPKCHKPLPKGAPRACPNCKMELTNFYKMKETRTQLEKENSKSAKIRKLMVICATAAVLCVLALIAVLVFSHKDEEPEAPVSEALSMEQVQAEINSKSVSDFTPSDTPTDYVKLTVRDFGEIVVRLRPDVAPISVRNFKDLVGRGFYTLKTFHRVYPGFMIQGGMGEEVLTPIKGEFQSNGVANPLRHVRGVLSMARTTVKDSATSQFFLMHADNPSLDGNYAAFGYIMAGLETVDKICEIPLGTNDRGEQSVPMVGVIIESAVFVTPN